ncbi:MAG: hypothetical protein KJ698_10600 [Actinobacteria bacterium]|nr:hypothetical protein [Actinomycetota bacterium]MBU1493038.1 hypothetical protein [Actinomycetota bacterium]MBU1865437.1 hypothetical protein [Actinomycetota bacterium]
MTLIRRPLTGLLALFVGALAIDRVALGAQEHTIQTPAYAVALAFVAAPLLVRGLRRTHLGTFLAMTGSTVAGAQVLSGRLADDPYQALVEAIFVTLAAALAHRLATGLDQLDQAINSVVFGESPALPLDSRQAANEILGEMARSRRHERPLSVTVLAPDPATLEFAVDHAAEEVQRAVRTQYVHSRVAQLIAEQLRRSDLLLEDPATGHFVVVSPETSSEGTALLVDRIRRAVEPTNVRLTSGHATFPDHALTFEQLVERAQDHMGHRAAEAGRTEITEGVA